MELTTAIKSGRCFNGAHRDKGIIVHLVPPLPANYSSATPWFTKALCGIEPGRRGYGWSNSNMEVTCIKCIKKNNKPKTTTMKKSIILLATASAMMLQSCAMLFSGTKDKVHVNNGNPNNAKVYYNGSLIGNAPCSINVPKKSLNEATVKIEADGFKTQEAKFTRKIKVGAFIGDCLFGFVWLIPDFLTGAIYKATPQKVNYDLSPSEVLIETNLKVGDKVTFAFEDKQFEGEIKTLYPNRAIVKYINKKGKDAEVEVPFINIAKK